ncbi:MAG TPA: flagellar hook-length control protein FliK [Limnobacter sp.]|nr:flagellar hook-length control protein FliK [Limnobacter sp.]
MSAGPQALNNISKTQLATGQKTATAKKEVELNFTDFFSSAMGQAAPQARLNGIEQQLREALFKQDRDRKDNAPNLPAEAAQAAQAAVWAQRNWMQSSQASASAEGRMESVGNQGAGQAAMSAGQVEGGSDNINRQAQATGASNPAEQEPGQAADAGTGTQQNQSAQSSAIKGTGNSEGKVFASAKSDIGTNETVVAAMTDPSKDGAMMQPASMDSVDTTQLVQQQTDSSSLQSTAAKPGKSMGFDQASESRPGNGQSMSADSNGLSVGNTSGENPGGPVSGTAGQVAQQSTQQLAQQAPQLAQQMQAMKESGEGEPGLKIGQKILAAGGIQNLANPNGVAVGLNGLNGTVGNNRETLIKTPVNQPGFSRELGQTVQWAIGKNLSTVDIRVNPESFGPMNMRLVQKGQQVQLLIRTQDEASANLLTQALGGLKEVLAQNGLQLNQVQVQHGAAQPQQGQAGGNAAAQQDQQSGQGQQRGHQHAQGQSSQQGISSGPTTPAIGIGRKPEGSLDLFA